MADLKGLMDIDATDIESNCNETTDAFDTMNLKPDLLRSIYAYGFENPSLVQQHAVMPIIKGNDVIAQAQSGTGKTAAFSIPILQRISSDTTCQAMVIAPTRLRVQQIQKFIMTIGNLTSSECYACVGGAPVSDNIEALQRGLHSVVMGTPGRVHDMIQRGVLCTDNITMFVLDEADEMLSRGFTEHIHDIFQMLLPQTTSSSISASVRIQIVLFSATMPQDVEEVITTFMRDPIRLSIKKDEFSLRGLKQFYVTVEDDQEDCKVESLSDLFQTIPNRRTIIFCQTRKKVEWLADKLIGDFAVSAMHGDMRADHRADIMRGFYTGSGILIATDLLARGVDVQHVPLVVNYDLPAKSEGYTHRVGNGGGGRSGCTGVAISLVNPEEVQRMHEIEHFYNTRMTKILAKDVADFL